ncbi:hypothetical protein C0J52_12526 [Blattella germanica]|nr:hypothetical protein C0J52_12526 [Blattella germanica]
MEHSQMVSAVCIQRMCMQRKESWPPSHRTSRHVTYFCRVSLRTRFICHRYHTT